MKNGWEEVEVKIGNERHVSEAVQERNDKVLKILKEHPNSSVNEVTKMLLYKSKKLPKKYDGKTHSSAYSLVSKAIKSLVDEKKLVCEWRQDRAIPSKICRAV